jgi:2-dehydro-3-deoxygluconokinase
MTKAFLGLGECMIELSGAGKNLWRQGFAGDVFNTLWYARAALGPEWQVQFHTGVGTDPISDDLVAFAAAAGIDLSSSPRIADRILGLYAIHLKEGERSFSYWRDASAARKMMANPDLARAVISGAEVVYLSGITMAILPRDDADLLVGLLAEARAQGKIVAFDPNIRPRLWAGRDDMLDVLSRAAGASGIVMPSFEDEAANFGDESPDATAARYLALGAGHVVVKNGAEPTVIHRNGTRTVHPVTPAPEVVDTTAAGDSFNGAYLAALVGAGDVGAAVRAGQSCAARVVGIRGALVPFAELAGPKDHGA